MNESFSDIFGTAIEFFIEGSLSADWLIGEDITLYSPFVIRSMQNPNLAWCPDTYGGLYWDFQSEEVHTNSGVQNFWFYLLSVGGSGVNDNGDPYSVTGIGIDDAAKIAYRNLTVYLTPTSNYHNSRAGSINAAADLFGVGSQQYLSVLMHGLLRVFIPSDLILLLIRHVECLHCSYIFQICPLPHQLQLLPGNGILIMMVL